MEIHPRNPVPERRKRMNDFSISFHLLWLVFLRLPLKSLFRCKAVCKVFNSIVSDPLFAADYRRYFVGAPTREPACAGIFLTRKIYPRKRSNYSAHFIPVSGSKGCAIPSEYELRHTFYPCRGSHSRSSSRFGTPPYYKNVIIASSGSILLCSGKEFVPGLNKSRTRHYVVNPLTKEWRSLPPSPMEREMPVIGFVCHEGVQVGTVACNYEYEIVKIQNDVGFVQRNTSSNTITNIIETYSSRSHEWSVVAIRSQVYWSFGGKCMTAVGGVFYWCDCEKFISYDPVTCKFEELSLPLPITAGGTHILSIGEGAHGSLILYATNHQNFDIWERISDKQQPYSWYRKRRVEFVEMVPQSLSTDAEQQFMSMHWQARPFPGVPDRVILDNSRDVLCYDLTSNKSEYLCKERRSVIHECFCYPYYLPSWHFQL